MKNNSGLVLIIIVVILIMAGGLYFVLAPKASAPVTISTSAHTLSVGANSVNYSCKVGTLEATYINNSVQLALSDGRDMTLPQVMSGSGIKYESIAVPGSAGTDIIFSSKGNDAFLTENGKITYDNCVAGTNTSSSTSTNGTQTFTDQGKTFSFEYPSGFAVSGGGVGYSQDWMQNTTTLGLLLVKATLPSTFEPKTNFADATFTVGTSVDSKAVSGCLTLAQSGNGVQKNQVIINGVQYTKFVTTDAGAGNIYQTTSYRTVRNNQCYAIEYTIHSSNIGNYSPDQGITAFDESKVQNVLEGIVQSFKFL